MNGKRCGRWATIGWICNCPPGKLRPDGSPAHQMDTGAARCPECRVYSPPAGGEEFWRTRDESPSVLRALSPEIKSAEQITTETEALLRVEGLAWVSAQTARAGSSIRVLKSLPKQEQQPDPDSQYRLEARTPGEKTR